MSRINLLLLQGLVAVVSVALWYALTTYPIFGKLLLPPFFFSNPVDVALQIAAWFATGVIWKHLWITLIEFDPCLCAWFDWRRLGRLLVCASATHRRSI